MSDIHPKFMWKDLDPDKLDPNIRQAVLKFQQLGYETMTSCQGGEGHAFKMPTVGITIKHQDIPSLQQHLTNDVVISPRKGNPAWTQQYAPHTNGEYVLVQGISLLAFGN